MGNGGKYGIPDVATFNTWGYSFTNDVPANSYDAAIAQTMVLTARTAGQLTPLSGNTSVPPVQTGNVTVSLASDNPASGTIVNGQSAADLGHFTFNGSGTVTQLLLTRTGVSSNSALDNVYLYQGTTRLTDGAAVSQNNTVTFTNAAGLFSVNGPTVISVRGDVDSNSANAPAGQTIGFQLSSGLTGNTAIAGTPITTNLFTVASVQNLAKIVLSQHTNPATTTVNAGTSNYIFWSNNLTVSNHNVQMKGAAFKYIGSAPTNAIQNWGLFVNGTKVGTSTGVNSNGYVAFDLTAAPVTLQTGSNLLEVHGDVIGGANRNVQLSLQNGADLQLFDTNYNVSVTPQNYGGSTYFAPTPSDGLVTISNGSLSISMDPGFNTTTNLPAGSANTVIGSYQVQSYGEDVQINTLSVLPVFTGSDPGLVSGSCTIAGHNCGLNNVSLYLNGAQIGTTQNWSGVATALIFNLGSSAIIPAGQTQIIQVKADLFNSNTGSQYTSGTIGTTLTLSANQAQGRTSFQPYPNADMPVGGQSLTIGGGNSTLGVNSSLLTGTTVLSNTPNTRIGSYVIQAGSAEGLRLNSLTVIATGGSGFSATTNLNNLKVVLSNCTGFTSVAPVQPGASNNFSVNCTIPQNSSATVDVYGDIGNNTGTLSTTLQATAQGATSNTNILGTGFASAAPGQSITIGTGSVNPPTIGGSAATSQLVASANTPTAGPASTAAFNFTATTGNATVQELWLKLVDYSGANLTTNQYVGSVTVSGPCTTGSANCTNGVSTSTATVIYDGSIATAHVTGLNILIPAGTSGQDISVVPTFNTVGYNGISSNHGVKIGVTQFKYQSGQTVLTSSPIGSPTYSNPMVVVASYPTITLDTNDGTVGQSQNASFGGNKAVLDFTITANAAGPIAVKNVGVTAYYSGSDWTAANMQSLSIYNINDQSTRLNAGQTSQALTTTATQYAIVFDTPQIIAAGTSKTFRVFANLGGMSATGDSFQLNLTNTGETFVDGLTSAQANKWAWNDQTGSSTTYANGYLVKQLPVTGPVFAK